MRTPIGWFLILSGVLFTIGTIGVLVRRNALVIFMSVELQLNAVNLSLVAFSRRLGEVDGQVLAFFSMVVAAAGVQRVFVFDVTHRAFIGARPLGSGNVFGMALDELRGRLYPVQSERELFLVDTAQVNPEDALAQLGHEVVPLDADADLIARLHHVRYTPRGVSYLLHRLSWTPQVPVHKAAERDEDLCELVLRERPREIEPFDCRAQHGAGRCDGQHPCLPPTPSPAARRPRGSRRTRGPPSSTTRRRPR